jgi:hypothetical protein
MSNWEDVEKVIIFLKYHIDSIPMVVHKKKRGALSEFKKQLLTKRRKRRGVRNQQHYCCVGKWKLGRVGLIL